MHKPIKRFFILAALIAAAISTTARAGLFDDNDARKAINTLTAQQQSDKAAHEAQFSRIDANIRSIETSIKNLGLVELAGQIDSLKADIKSLRGQQEVLTNSIETTQKKQRDFYLDLDSRIKRLEETAAAPPPAPVSVAPPAVAPVVAAPAPTPAPVVVSAPPVESRSVPQPPPMPGTKKK